MYSIVNTSYENRSVSQGGQRFWNPSDFLNCSGFFFLVLKMFLKKAILPGLFWNCS